MTNLFKYIIQKYRNDSGEVESYRVVVVEETLLLTIYKQYFNTQFNTLEEFKEECYCNHDIYKILKKEKAIVNEYYDY